MFSLFNSNRFHKLVPFVPLSTLFKKKSPAMWQDFDIKISGNSGEI